MGTEESRLFRSKSDDCLTLISWNIHGLPFVSGRSPFKRMEAVANKIREERPDLVLLQEVWFSAYQRRLEQKLGDDYETILDPRRVLGWPRGGLLVFVRCGAGWTIEESAFRRYNRAAPWWRLDEGDGISGKGYLTIKLRRDGRRLMIVDTHLQSQYPEHSRAYEEIRHSQLDQLQTYLGEFPSSQPVLIAGDFNTKPTEGLYSSHLNVLGTDLTDAERAQCGCGTAFDEKGEAKDWLDYVIARHFATEADVMRIVNDSADIPYSDHDGLLVRLSSKSVAPRAGFEPATSAANP